MSRGHNYDVCADCGKPIADAESLAGSGARTPCPDCGSTRRIKFGECNMIASMRMNVDAKLVISWQEVGRLQDRNEYAAALLVAAVNVEFILWENLRRFAPSALSKADNNIKSVWGQIRANKPETVSLGSLLKVTEFFSKHDKLRLSPTWDPIASVINEVKETDCARARLLRRTHETQRYRLARDQRSPGSRRRKGILPWERAVGEFRGRIPQFLKEQPEIGSMSSNSSSHCFSDM